MPVFPFCSLRLTWRMFFFFFFFCQSNEPGNLSEVGTRNLRGIGQLLAVDVVVNNWDRLPFGSIWQNSGNLGNFGEGLGVGLGKGMSSLSLFDWLA